MMKITKMLVKIGGSLGIIIDQPICKKLKLKHLDWLELDLKKARK